MVAVDAQIMDVMGVERKLRTTNFKMFGDIATEFYRLIQWFEVTHYVFDLYITHQQMTRSDSEEHMKVLLFLLSNSHS